MRRRVFSVKLLWVLLSVIITGCSKEEFIFGEENVPIDFFVKDAWLQTRVPVTVIDATNVKNIGLYGVVYGSAADSFPWTRTPFISNLSPTQLNNGQLQFSSKLYYPMGGRNVRFYAYYPVPDPVNADNYIIPPSAGVAPSLRFTLTGQQDIMHAVATSSSGASGPVSLVYVHKLCQIRLELSALTGTLTGISLLGVTNKGNMNIQTGVVTYDAATVNLTIAKPLLGTLTDPLLVPAGVASYTVEVSLLGLLKKSYLIKPQSGNFLPGLIYQIKL